MMVFYMFLMALCNFEIYRLSTMFWMQAILNSTTIELVFRNYWWPQLWKYVKEFVGFYNVCVWVKNPHHCPHGFRQLLLIFTSPWFLIFMDFITNLPLSSFYISILVVVDHLTKMVHFIPCTKTISNKRTTKLFLNHVFQYHVLPQDIISNYKP
jgi:hypothetical protein